jgi:hypothetical protein
MSRLSLLIREYVLQAEDVDEALNRCTDCGLDFEQDEIFKYTEELRHALVEGTAIPQGRAKLADHGIERGILHDGGIEERSNGDHEGDEWTKII